MHEIEMKPSPKVSIEFDGQTLQANEGETVAAALLRQTHLTFRTTPVTGKSRGPFCMMGVCFDCLVEIDGAPNKQACMTYVEDGMRVKRQLGAGDTGVFLSDEEDTQ